MSTVRGVKDRRFKFVQLLNSMFEDPKLSLKAKGLIGFCLTKTEDWVFHVDHLISVLKEGRDSIYTTINECIEQGYAYRRQLRDEKGRASIVEFIISDSKVEIATIKNDIESDPKFKKFIPNPENPDPVSPVPEKPEAVPLGKNDPLYSNTDSSNMKGTATTTSSAAASFYKELESIEIPVHDKVEITKTYPIQNVKHALLWLAKNDKPLTKGIAATLKWASKTLPSIPESKKVEKIQESPEAYNRNYYRQIETVASLNGVRLHNHGIRDNVEYVQTEHDKIYFKDKSFLEQISSCLRKKSIECRNVFNMIKACQADLVKQLC